MNDAEKRAAVGLFVWAFYLLVEQPGAVNAFLLLAALVHLPLALRLLGVSRRMELAWVAAAGALTASFFLKVGLGSAALAAPWLALTIAVAAIGAHRLAWQGVTRWPEVAIQVGAVFLAVGGAWTLASRAGLEPLGFTEPWVALTGVHFHYAAFLLPLIVGCTGRLAPRPRGRLVVAGLLVAIPLTAVGIAWSPVVELVAALLLVVSAFGAATLLWVRPTLRLPAVSLVVAMVLAGGWAMTTGGGLELEWLTLEQMAWTHGTLNAVVVSAAALFALVRAGEHPSLPMPPFSLLRGGPRIGADWFERDRLTVPGTASGLVDRLDELAGPDFDPAVVDDRIRAFYERTDEFALHVTPDWAWWIRPGARLWGAIARHIDQTQFPLTAESADDALSSRIVDLDPAADGRDAPRGWVRTFGDGRAMYVAAYATHRLGDRAYMNIAFPLPASNLASILAARNTAGGGLILDTSAAAGEHCGIWLVVGPGALRLPMREDITVEVDDGELVARHVLRLFGVRYLTLHYRMSPENDEHLEDADHQPEHRPDE